MAYSNVVYVSHSDPHVILQLIDMALTKEMQVQSFDALNISLAFFSNDPAVVTGLHIPLEQKGCVVDAYWYNADIQVGGLYEDNRIHYFNEWETPRFPRQVAEQIGVTI